MPDTHCRFCTVKKAKTALFSILVTAIACDPAVESDVTDAGQVDRDGTIQADDLLSVPRTELEGELADLLISEADPAALFGCKLDTFRFRLANDAVAIATPPGGFFTPFPVGIPTFDDPKLQDSYVFLVTMRDLDNNVVGYASEQEVVDLVNNKSQTSYTVTLPDRGTLMLTERESFQVLMDAVDDMIADGEMVRTFNPPLVKVLTIPGTGKVVGGSGEFENAFGVMQEIGVVYKIDLTNNEFDLGVIVQALHC